MNKIVNKFSLAGDRFMSELHLRQPGFTDGACGPFTKHREIIQKFKEAVSLKHIYKNELKKLVAYSSHTHDATYSDSKDLTKRTISGKVLKERAYEIAINPKSDGYHEEVTSMVYKFFDKNSGASVNEELAQETHKPIIKKFIRRKVDARFKDNIWLADLGEMGLFRSKNRSRKY